MKLFRINKKEWNEGLDCLDLDLVEKYVEQKDRIRQKKKKSVWLRFGAIAACFALIVGAVIVLPMLQGGDSLINPPNKDIPTISTMTSGNKITGKQELLYGNPESDNSGEAEIMLPCFLIRTVIEAEVIEVLPDTYYYAALYYEPFHVAKLRVVDQIRGEGLPAEIFLCYPYYDTTILDGYDRFILSLSQVGVENYMLINDTQKRVDYFSNMFLVCCGDLGYGSVIAFRSGKVDESFWEKANFLISRIPGGSDWISTLLDDPDRYDYPASHNSTIGEVKARILELANDEDNGYLSNQPCNYVTADDIFISDAAKEVRSYVEPSDTNVFMQSIAIYKDRVVAQYTRMINGFATGEVIVINGYDGENGNVSRRGEAYTAEDLAKVPNIGEVLANMNLSELQPSHIEILEEMHFKYAHAMGVYRKVDGKVYGIIRVLWYYTHPRIMNGYVMDDCYYLYDENGNGTIVERDELKELLGDDLFVARFSYDQVAVPPKV